MAKFKVGDTVRWLLGDCVTMTHLKEYRVEWVYKGVDENVYIKNDKGSTGVWSERRFELVVPPVPKAIPSTYTVTWKVHPIKGYQSLIDGELSFGSQDLAEGFASLFKPVVLTTVTKD
jgi:hypothetical protein